MAVIDAKKLLPPSKKGGAIEKQKVLVPLKNISSKKISAGDLKPTDKESKTSEDLSIIKSKVIQIDVLLRNSYTIDKRNAEARRKEEERKRSEKREKNIESKVKKNQVSTNLISSIPGQSIFDKINRFIGFTILGYLFNQYGKLLPKLLEFGKIIEPVGKFVENFAKNLLKGAVDFVEFGYKAYDQTRDFVKQIGGEGAQKTFDEFSKNLNLILNGAIAASMLIISTAPKKPRGGKPGPGRLGGMPGGKPSSIPKNTKLASYLDRDPQTKLIERRYGNDAARMYEARKAQGASVSRARADVVKRFDKFEGPQRGLGGGTGKGSILSRGIGKSANRTALKVLGKTGTRIARGVFGRIPIVGGLIDFAFSLAMGEKPGRAAAKAVGATVGSALGTFIPIPFAGTILGGILGDIVGGALYDTLIGGNKKPVQARAEGGIISRGGQSSVAPSRRLKTKPRKVSPKIEPQRTQPGKDAGGKQRIEELYGKDEPNQKSALRALKKSSEDVKKMRSINGLAGAMFGAGIDMTLGQKPDRKLAKSIGDVFGSVVQNAVNAELNNSFNDISKTIAMANGGVVPTREIGKSLSIGQKIGKFISTALAVSIESSATKILQNLNRELNLQGGGDGGPPGPDGDIPGARLRSGTTAQREADLLEYFTALYGKNAALGIVANLWRETGLRTRTGDRPGDSQIFQGIAQWTKNDRWPRFVKWAESKGLDPWSLNAQAQYIAVELKEYGTDKRLKQAKSPEEAAQLFYEEFEKGADTGSYPGSSTEEKHLKFLEGIKQRNPDIGKRADDVLVRPPQSSGPDAMVIGGIKPSQIPITSYQGQRYDPFTGQLKQHRGIDLAGVDGSPISSAQDATVVHAGFLDDGYGNSVILRYSNGAETRFGHLKSVNVRKGQSIKAGQLIGRQGNTGRSTNSHLHFEYYPNGGAMTYRGEGDANSVKDSYFRYGGNVKPKPAPTQPPAPPGQPNPRPGQKPTGNKGVVYEGGKFIKKGGGLFGTDQEVSVTDSANTDLRATVAGFGLGQGTEGQVKKAKDGRFYRFINGKWIYSSSANATQASLAPSQSSAVASFNRSGILEQDTSYSIEKTLIVYQTIEKQVDKSLV